MIERKSMPTASQGNTSYPHLVALVVWTKIVRRYKLLILSSGTLFSLFIAWILLSYDKPTYIPLASKHRKVETVGSHGAYKEEGEDVKAVIERRRQQVDRVCSEIHLSRPPGKKSQFPGYHKFRERSFYSPSHRFIYCPVWKTASTFGRRFFYQLLKSRRVKVNQTVTLLLSTVRLRNNRKKDIKNTETMLDVKSPFDVSVNFTKYAMKYFSHPPDNLKTIRNALSLLYVRNPYSRVFAVYIDKLMAPNPYFWKIWGTHNAISRSRTNSLVNRQTDAHMRKKKRKQCKGGHDVTFNEFVDFVTHAGHRFDFHFIPITASCSPCSVNYTVVGKMETFQRDTEFMLQLLNISPRQIGFERMAQDAVDDAIEDSSRDALSKEWLNRALKCVSKEDVVKRIVRKLQIRGFISWRYRLQLNGKQLKHLEFDDFVKMMKESREIYKNETELKIQKRQAYVEAFRTLDRDKIWDIKRVYETDCRMFGYQTLPDFINTPDPGFVFTGALDWQRDWDLSPVL